MLLGIATLVLLWRRSAIGFVGAWVLLILSPTLVVPIVTEVAAERRMYLPLAALVTLAVVGGFALAQQWGRCDSLQKRAERSVSRWPVVFASVAAIALVLVLSLVSVRRLAAYHDNLTLWEDAVVYQPDDPVIHNSLSFELAKIGRLQEAIEQCEQAVQLNPNFVDAHNNLGLALLKKGRLQEAIGHFQQALQIRPDSAGP